jgi:asparagine synthase (glutamine-hydrolysing)
MCGILAVIERGRDTWRHEEKLFESALDLLQHRGPDDRGVWHGVHAWLGHRRLAIIDLSPGGHQPMTDAETGVTITFGGEIYNYLELREELGGLGHQFRTQSDTEVLLRAYLAWGHQCLGRLNGMWHFVVWDPRDNTAFIARDRFGVKPCYYSLIRGRLIVGSEPKAILMIEPALCRVDKSALCAFLVRSALCSDTRSFYDGVSILPPAHYSVFDVTSGGFAIKRYWVPPPEMTDTKPVVLEQVAGLIADSVRLRMRSDVPVGITLSGGLDSSAILTEAVKHAGRLTAFTSTYRSVGAEEEISEERWARLAAAPFANVELRTVDSAAEDWIATLRRIAWHMDGPADAPAVFPLWRIMERARAVGVPVLLEGQGGDELLGGYVQYAALDILDVLSKALRHPVPAHWGAFARALFRYSRTFSATRLCSSIVRAEFPGLLPAYRRHFGPLGTLRRDFLAEFDSATVRAVHGSRVHTRLLNDLQYDTLPSLLQYGDAVSMAHGIESRFPFLDYRLVEFCVSLPISTKIADGQTKRILRALLHRAGLPRIADRREKKGYPTPISFWLAARNGELARQILLAPGARIHEFCDPRGLARLIRTHLRGVNVMTGFHLYRLVSTEVWLQQCITHAMPGSGRAVRLDSNLASAHAETAT